MTEKKKLIEVALPLDAINAEAAREKSIRHGHPSTLHLWWARRPLAACRAVLFAQLVDDPSSHPDRFPTPELQEKERLRLFEIIERLVKWENSNDPKVLAEAQAEIRACFDGEPPAILDPFCGGGSIPLEAQRLGLEADASDLNPVAVLITKALIEIPPRWAGRAPVHPDEGKLAKTQTWSRAQGLAEDIRYYGQWMRDEAERRIGHLYPKATLPDGTEANVIAWIWARTVTCPNPACQATMPLVRSFWLGKKKGKEAWVEPIVEGKSVQFVVQHGADGPAIAGTVRRTGATCIVCDTPVAFEYVRSEGRAGRMSAQLMAVVAEGNRQRVYLTPSSEHERSAAVAPPEELPIGDLPERALSFRVQAYGMRAYTELFTNRQLHAMKTFADLARETRTKIIYDAVSRGTPQPEALAYAAAVATYLAFGVSRLANRGSTLSVWNTVGEKIEQAFARQAIPMTWDFPEANPFSASTGGWTGSLEWIPKVLEALAPGPLSYTRQADASSASGMPLEGRPGAVIATDPPYYDNIGYADLSDFFYVWLRWSLRDVYPDVFATMLTPKHEELVATPYRFAGNRAQARTFFEEGFVRTFQNARDIQAPLVPMTLFYAFKQAEDEEEGQVSTGWATLLEGIVRARWTVTATWPLRTERDFGVKTGANVLASSVLLACRPRDDDAGVTDRRAFLTDLKRELPSALRVLQRGSIAPVDLAQSALGPGIVVTPWLLDVQAAVLCSLSAAARASAGVVSLPRLSCGRSVL